MSGGKGFWDFGRANISREECVRRGAASAIERTLKAGAQLYERARDLPKLARVALPDLTDNGIESGERIVGRLESALRAERNRARSGHWTYDLNRHIALRQAYLAESERLRVLKGGPNRAGLSARDA